MLIRSLKPWHLGTYTYRRCILRIAVVSRVDVHFEKATSWYYDGSMLLNQWRKIVANAPNELRHS